MLQHNKNISYPQLVNKVILNVDDNELNQMVISKILKMAGMKVISATNGAIAIQLLNEGLRPDSILMDIQMPVMDGIETAEIIKKNIDPAVPIIINSGLVTMEQKIKLFKLGVEDFLEKPYTLDDIFNKLLKNMLVRKPLSN